MKTIYVTAILTLIILISSCGTSQKSTSANGRNNQYTVFTEIENSQGSSKTKIEAGSMLIYDAELRLSMKNTDSAQSNINAIAKKYGGYLLNSSPTLVTIRILSADLHTACDEIARLGKAEQVFHGRDVSDEFRDLNIRLENAEKTRKRYLELLDRANGVDDALKIERELERLNGTIDLLKGKMQQIEHLVAYSTVTVHVNKKRQLGPLSYVGLGVYKIVKFLFVWN